MAHSVFQLFFEFAVFLVDVQIIFFVKIVTNIEVRPLIAVDVTNGDAKSEADKAAINTSLFAYIRKTPLVVSQQLITTSFQKIFYLPVFCPQFTFVGIVECVDRYKAIVEDIGIEVAVFIVVKKSGMGSVTPVVQTIFSGPFGECQILVIDEQLIGGFYAGLVACIAHIDIQPAVVVDIYHYHTRTPVYILLAKGCLGDVFKLEISLI